jgi:hypothetical protein
MSGGELPAIGWFTDIIDRGVNGLWAGVKWTDEGVQLLQQRAFKYFSPEFYEDYEDPETRKKHGHVLVGARSRTSPTSRNWSQWWRSASQALFINLPKIWI